MDDTQRRQLERFSRGETTALDVRRRFGGATFGEILQLLSEAQLPLPRAPVAGREAQIDRARGWMFPRRVP